ncbi:MAG: hypothetical protein AAGA66_18625 [Bacteroidota bacterium]
MTKTILLFFSLTLTVGVASAQFNEVLVFFDGPSSASLSQVKTYTVAVSGGSHSSTSYTVSGGQITSQSKTSVSVRWTATGTRSVTARPVVNGTSYSQSRIRRRDRKQPAS